MPTPRTMAGRPNCWAGAAAARTRDSKSTGKTLRSHECERGTQECVRHLLFCIGGSFRLGRHGGLSAGEDILQVIVVRQSFLSDHVDGLVDGNAHGPLFL